MASLSFDANTIQPQSDYQPLPAGEYEVMIIDSTMEPTKAGTGQFLKLQMQVLSGPHQNATLFDRLNLINPNPTAVDIAQRTLSSICHAVGVLQVTDSSQLHNRPMIARVVLKPGDANYGPSNEIRNYKPKQSAQAYQAPAPMTQPVAAQQAPAQAAPAPAAAGAPPWMSGQQQAA